MKYLIGVVRATDEAYQGFKSWRNSVVLEHGVSAEARIDWRFVANFCAPHVLLVMSHDKSGKEFEDHPVYAVLTETQQSLPLYSDVDLIVQKSDDANAEVDVVGALNSLSTYAQSLDEGKRENALKQLRILTRILR